jgi:hypothetical protein
MTKIPTLEAMTSSSDQRRWTLRRWEPLIVWGVSWCIGKGRSRRCFCCWLLICWRLCMCALVSGQTLNFCNFSRLTS